MNQTQNTTEMTQSTELNKSAKDRIKNLFNWGELSRLLSGTRSVVLKNKYPKKHEPFISDLCEAVKPVMIKHGYESPDTPITPEAVE